MVTVIVNSEFHLNLDGDTFADCNGGRGIVVYRNKKLIGRFPHAEGAFLKEKENV